MAGDLTRDGALGRRTAAAMWAAYSAHAAATSWVFGRRVLPVPVPARWIRASRVGGTTFAAVGAALVVAGAGRFSGGAEVTGTRNQPLLTAGVYRYSRNPQYLGYVVVLIGAGIARRSGAVLLSAATLAAVYDAWVRVEERHLEQVHGDRYRSYRTRTARWCGPPAGQRTDG